MSNYKIAYMLVLWISFSMLNLMQCVLRLYMYVCDEKWISQTVAAQDCTFSFLFPQNLLQNNLPESPMWILFVARWLAWMLGKDYISDSRGTKVFIGDPISYIHVHLLIEIQFVLIVQNLGGGIQLQNVALPMTWLNLCGHSFYQFNFR